MTGTMIGKKREHKESVIVVLEGMKVTTEKTGVAPLIKALRDYVGANDELLVLSIINTASMPSSSSAPGPSEGEAYDRFLRQEISRRKVAFKQVFRPFYDSCKSKAVKFQVKIAAGQPQDLILEAVNYFKATWIFMDSCFAREVSFRLNGTDCNVSLVSDDEESQIQKFLPPKVENRSMEVKEVKTKNKEQDTPHSLPIVEGKLQPLPPALLGRTSRESENIPIVGPHAENKDITEVKPPKKGPISDVCVTARKKSDTKLVLEQPMQQSWEVIANISDKEQDTPHSLQTVEGELKPLPPALIESTSRESENIPIVGPRAENKDITEVKSPKKGPISDVGVTARKESDTKLVLEQPMQLSWEVIATITEGFTRYINRNENFTCYAGCLSANCTVLVRRFDGHCNSILNAEKNAAMTMCHRNILGLIGYHQSEDATFLVYPSAPIDRLDRCISVSKGKHIELTFQKKVKIAISIAQGLRYMHEECPQGPVVHGELQTSSILLEYDFNPLISHFEKATWLQQEQASLISKNRPKDSSDLKSLTLIKSEIFSFGVLLLRLFCHRFAPKDDKTLIEWARPLVLKRAFHELLGEDSEDYDTHGVLKVMSAALQCTRTNPLLRPCMSEVISILKGEIFCSMPYSPSDSE